jgi:hypothetical protein
MRPIHNRSHIIPDFMFRMAREHKKDQLLYVDLNTMATDPNYHPRRRRRHPHVKEMFCTTCECLLQRYDDYLDAVFKNPSKRPTAIQPRANALPRNDLLMVWTDHEAWRIPLAIMSIVLRGVLAASREPFYMNVHLDQHDITLMRELVLGEQWSNQILTYDFVVLKTDSENPADYPAIVTSPEVNYTAEGSLIGVFVAAGGVFLIGRPCPAFSFSGVVPRPAENRFYMPLKSPESMSHMVTTIALSMLKATQIGRV